MVIINSRKDLVTYVQNEMPDYDAHGLTEKVVSAMLERCPLMYGEDWGPWLSVHRIGAGQAAQEEP